MEHGEFKVSRKQDKGIDFQHALNIHQMIYPLSIQTRNKPILFIMNVQAQRVYDSSLDVHDL